MSTAAEHHAEADNLIGLVTEPHPQITGATILKPDADPRLIMLAGVHAALALASVLRDARFGR